MKDNDLTKYPGYQTLGGGGSFGRLIAEKINASFPDNLKIFTPALNFSFPQ